MGILIEGLLARLKQALNEDAREALWSDPTRLKFKRPKQDYELVTKLGQGGFGEVYKYSRKSDKKQVVIKRCPRNNPMAPVEDILQEFSTMKSLDHPRIAKSIEVFHDEEFVYMVNEFCEGGDLAKLRKDGKISLQTDIAWFRDIFEQILVGLRFLHRKHITHCDIKEENIRLSTKDSDKPAVVLIDFGLCQSFCKGEVGLAGTPGYIAPEIIGQMLITPKADTFAFGATAYSLLADLGESPFRFWTVNAPAPHLGPGGVTRHFLDPLVRCEEVGGLARLNNEICGCISLPRKGLMVNDEPLYLMVVSALHWDFRRRPTVGKLLEYPWLQQKHGQLEDTEGSASQKLAQVREMGPLQKGLFENLVADKNLATLQELNKCFTDIDKDGDGTVDK